MSHVLIASLQISYLKRIVIFSLQPSDVLREMVFRGISYVDRYDAFVGSLLVLQKKRTRSFTSGTRMLYVIYTKSSGCTLTLHAICTRTLCVIYTTLSGCMSTLHAPPMTWTPCCDSALAQRPRRSR